MVIQHHETKLALGSDVTLMVVADASEQMIKELFSDLWQTIYQFERRFSRFIPMSELSVFNRSPGRNVPISPEFKDILTVAKQLSSDTDGLFNPLILPALQRAGYTKSFVDAYADDTQDDYSHRSTMPADQLEIGDNWASIPYGSALDLGGCGKGYLADQLANYHIPDWVQGYWLSLGGDVVGQGFDIDGSPWEIAITGADEWKIITTGRRFAAATSSTNVRKGTHNSKNWHHIIDPRTLKPADSDVTSATVYCPSAVQADVLASCAIIIGSAHATTFLKKRSVLAACLQSTDDTGRPEWKHFGSALRPAVHPKTKENSHV